MSHQDDTLNQLKTQTAVLQAIAQEIARLAQSNRALPYRRHLAEYLLFDWASIGAIIIAGTANGPEEVEWQGHRYTRRNATGGKFGDAIWYSRALTDQDAYEVLIKFADYQAEPLKVDFPQTEQPNPTPPREEAHFQRRVDRQEAREITPLDVQDTRQAAQALTQDRSATLPDSKPEPQRIPAEIDPTADPRKAFYELGPKAIQKQVIDFQQFNDLVTKAGRTSFAEALQDLVNLVQPALAGA